MAIVEIIVIIKGGSHFSPFSVFYCSKSQGKGQDGGCNRLPAIFFYTRECQDHLMANANPPPAGLPLGSATLPFSAK